MKILYILVILALCSCAKKPTIDWDSIDYWNAAPVDYDHGRV